MIKSLIKFFLLEKNKSQRYRKYAISETLRAGDERIELPPKVLETPIIPLDQSPIFLCRTRYLYHITLMVVNRKIENNTLNFNTLERDQFSEDRRL